MSVAKVTEIISASNVSFEEAIKTGLARASKTIDGIREAWVSSQKVAVENGSITEYRVVLKITFMIRD